MVPIMNSDVNKVLNNQVMIDLIGNDAVMIRKFKIEFLQQAHKTMQEIVREYQQSNFSALKEQAHYLKTSAKAIGAEITGDLLQSLEESALAKNKEACKQTLIKTNQAIKSVYEVISNENQV